MAFQSTLTPSDSAICCFYTNEEPSWWDPEVLVLKLAIGPTFKSINCHLYLDYLGGQHVRTKEECTT